MVRERPDFFNSGKVGAVALSVVFWLDVQMRSFDADDESVF